MQKTGGINMKNRKLLSLVLSVAIVALLGCNRARAATVVESEIDSALLNRGYPQIVLEHMSLSAKESIYGDTSLYFKSATITTYDQETHEFEDYTIQSDGIMPIGQIPAADLSLVWSISGVLSDPSLIKVKYSYQWNSLPFFRWQDNIGVSWDDTLFEMQPGSFYKVDKLNGELVDPNTGITTSYINGAIQSEEYGYANGYPSGVTWYADLKGYIGPIVTSLYGHGEFTLERKTSGHGTTYLYGHYVHPQIAVGANITINKHGSFSVSAGGLYDERGNSIKLNY